MVQTLIAGNWKMNGLKSALNEISHVAQALPEKNENTTALLCLPATLIAQAHSLANGSALKIGAETCHVNEAGAHTGDISAEMLADAGAEYVIVGHSERRTDHGETNDVVAAQAAAAHRAGIVPIICIGESLEQREAGQTLDVLDTQLSNSLPKTAKSEKFVIAYEPVWAIGTGKVATEEQIEEVHNFLREALVRCVGDVGQNVPLLYGGSMKPGNAASILSIAEVNGGLIGGASLKADDFMAIYAAA